jgi:hypothetical protein
MIEPSFTLNCNKVLKKADLYPTTTFCSVELIGISGKQSFSHDNASSISKVPVISIYETGKQLN